MPVSVVKCVSAMAHHAGDDGLGPVLSGIPELNLSDRLVSSTEERETICVALQEFTVVRTSLTITSEPDGLSYQIPDKVVTLTPTDDH